MKRMNVNRTAKRLFESESMGARMLERLRRWMGESVRYLGSKQTEQIVYDRRHVRVMRRGVLGHLVRGLIQTFVWGGVHGTQPTFLMTSIGHWRMTAGLKSI